MKTLFILLDAFRHDYINPVDTPFLHAKISTGMYVRKLRSSTGFTQRTEVMTGTCGATSGRFTMHLFDSENSPYRFLRGNRKCRWVEREMELLAVLPGVPGLRWFRRRLRSRAKVQLERFRRTLRRRAEQEVHNAPPGQIPLSMLHEIGFSEDIRPLSAPGAYDELETIVDVLARENRPFDFLMYPEVECRDDLVLERVARGSQIDDWVCFAQFADSDALVHRFGPGSPERRSVAGEIDRKLRVLDAAFGNDCRWVIAGDHGMTDVQLRVDAAAEIAVAARNKGVRLGRDYLLFLDSTLARFRFKSPRGWGLLDEIKNSQMLAQHGRFLDNELAAELSIPFGDRRYGDLVWMADVGVLIDPDYFHDGRSSKGMHGYRSDHDDMKGIFLSFGPGIATGYREEARLRDVCPTICAAAGVAEPAHNEGTTLVRVL
ncbi:hypothetical protein GF356_10530 [candidate division GN15 bacterium]|nr:hypothetical protein [candidate division GN15 bacterium]